MLPTLAYPWRSGAPSHTHAYLIPSIRQFLPPPPQGSEGNRIRISQLLGLLAEYPSTLEPSP
jgi:hypothetical protein